MTWLKIGALYVNVEQATEIRDTGVDLEIFYRGTERATTLRGSEAEALRTWLEVRSEKLTEEPS